MNRIKYCAQFILVLMVVLLPLSAFSLVKTRQDYPFIIPIANPVGQGTGIVIDGNIVTNFHNIEPVFNFQFPIENHLFVIDHKHTPVPVTEITALDAKVDLAVVQTKKFSADGYSVNSFYEIKEENLGETATIVGFPDGQFKTVEGVITKVNDNDAIEVERANKGALGQMDGFSGAAVFVNGRLAGIHSKSAEETAYFIPVNKIRELLSRSALSCSPVPCIEEEIQKLISLSQNGDEKARARLREYVEKNIETVAMVQMFPRYREFQDRMLVDGVQVMRLFSDYYEQFKAGNSMEQQVFNKNLFFNLALKARWAEAIQLRKDHNLRKIRHNFSGCGEYF